MENLNPQNQKNENESSNRPETDEEDDFFTLLDKQRGLTDEQLRQKQLEEEQMNDMEVTKAMLSLSKDDQEVFERTNMIHFDRQDPVETQVMKAITLQRKKEAKNQKIQHMILVLMIIGIGLCLIGIVAGSAISNKNSTATSQTKTNPLAVAETEEPVKISEKSFPDASFREYISKNADTDSDGSLSPDERNAFLIITLNGDKNLKTVKGIELFPLLQAINLSNTALSEINVAENTLLDNINLSSTSITALDLSKNVNVSSINVSNSPIKTLTLPAPSEVKNINTQNTSISCEKNGNYYTGCLVK